MSALSIAGFTRRAVNATWRDVEWAGAQLQPHAGKTLRVEFWPLPFPGFSLQITADGAWEDIAAQAEQQPDATLRLTPALLPRFATAPNRLGAAIELDGEPTLVQALRDVFDVLPLALEERLSAVIGPIAAHGVSSTMRAAVSWPGHAAERLGVGIATYLTEESATLLKPAALEKFRSDVDALRERVDRLAADTETAQ